MVSDSLPGSRLVVGGFLLVLALAGCSVPERAAPPPAQPSGDVIQAATFSTQPSGTVLPQGWKPLIILRSKRRTDYSLVEDQGQVVMRAEARKSASGLHRDVNVDPARHRFLKWRWRVDAPVSGADPRKSSSEDAPARVLVSFYGDLLTLDPFEQTNLAMASALSGQAIPYATLIYIWSDKLPVDSVVPNPRTERVQMVVADSGPAEPGKWVTLERDLLEDFRRAFGEEPGPIERIGLMTDTDNTADTAVSFYGDMEFRAQRDDE